MNNARINKIGAVFTTSGKASSKGFEVILKSNSMLDTLAVRTRSRRHKYWVKATARDPQSVVLNKRPKR